MSICGRLADKGSAFHSTQSVNYTKHSNFSAKICHTKTSNSCFLKVLNEYNFLDIFNAEP